MHAEDLSALSPSIDQRGTPIAGASLPCSILGPSEGFPLSFSFSDAFPFLPVVKEERLFPYQCLEIEIVLLFSAVPSSSVAAFREPSFSGSADTVAPCSPFFLVHLKRRGNLVGLMPAIPPLSFPPTGSTLYFLPLGLSRIGRSLFCCVERDLLFPVIVRSDRVLFFSVRRRPFSPFTTAELGILSHFFFSIDGRRYPRAPERPFPFSSPRENALRWRQDGFSFFPGFFFLPSYSLD